MSMNKDKSFKMLIKSVNNCQAINPMVSKTAILSHLLLGLLNCTQGSVLQHSWSILLGQQT